MLDVATKLFAEKGFKAVGIREITHQCGVALSSLYHHFGNKWTLYLHAHMREFGNSSNRLRAALEQGDNDVARLAFFTTELCRLVSEPGPLFKLAARRWLEADSEVVKALELAAVPEEFRAARATIHAIAPERNPTATMLAIYSLVQGLITLRPFEDSLPWKSGVPRQPVAMAQFVLSTLLPELDWQTALESGAERP